MPEEDACLHIRDLAIQRGYGVFDFLKVLNGYPVFMEQHLQRFYYSAEQMHLAVPYKIEEIKNIIQSLLLKNECSHTGVRMTLTGGYSADGYQIAIPNLIIETRPFSEPTAAQLAQGIHLISFEHQRQLPHVKTIDYLMAIWLRDLLEKNGADDVLYHQHGWVTECPRSNFFIVHNDNRIVTPAAGILKGVIRNKLLEYAPGKHQLEERSLSLQEIKTAKEAFITSTTKTILPVTRLDDYIFPGDGLLTSTLREAMLLLSGKDS